MKLPFLAAACAVIAALFLAGTPAQAATKAQAQAHYPIKSKTLKHNKLYGTGALDNTECVEPEVESTVSSAKRYVRTFFDCLSTSWESQFEKAGMSFAKPSLRFYTSKKGLRFCGEKWGNAAGAYCWRSRQFAVLLDKQALRDIDDLFLLDVVAHEYGHHVQLKSGIMRAYDYEPYHSKREETEQTRRLELQAECLAGAFIGSVWDSLDRSSSDWQYLLDIVAASGDETSKVKDHGKGRIQKYWLRKGFEGASPGSCNTWSAPASRVA
ncbi:MAG: hypothetical protein HOY71_08655 [Nonomuraea sp.]|nr:hypothetical protein [Nonomuraea sp.]